MTDIKGSSDFIMVPDFKKSLFDSVKISYPSLNKNREERDEINKKKRKTKERINKDNK